MGSVDLLLRRVDPVAVLRIGDWNVDVEAALLGLVHAPLNLERFVRPPASDVSFRARWAAPPTLKASSPLDPARPMVGRGHPTREGLTLSLSEGPNAGAVAFQAIFQGAVLRQGGLMIHAAAVSSHGRAAVVFGPSGAGKSTFARWCRQAGLAILSDETVALFPDGRVFGTPFTSDVDLVGTECEAKVEWVASLRQGGEERLDPLSPDEATKLLWAQVYRPLPEEMGRQALLERVSTFAERFEIRRVTLRNHASAGTFVGGTLHA